tara:strand:+ start:8170 stop:8352 length:183 start_codon:yes stop_codon:yes gene_type:complete
MPVEAKKPPILEAVKILNTLKHDIILLKADVAYIKSKLDDEFVKVESPKSPKEKVNNSWW